MRSREKIDYFAFHCSLLKTYLLVEINFQHFYTPLKQVILQHHSGYMLVLLVIVITVGNLYVLLLRLFSHSKGLTGWGVITKRVKHWFVK